MQEATKAKLGLAYLRTIQTSGSAILIGCATDLAIHPPGWLWLLLVGITALTGTHAVKIPGVVVRLSVSEPIVFLATLLFGPAAGTLTAVVDALVMSLRLPPHLRTPHRLLFNVGALAVTVLPSALLYFRLTGLDARAPKYAALEAFVGPLYVFAACVFLFNSWLVALAVSFERKVSAFAIWRSQFLWLFASYFASAAIAAILVVLTHSLDFALVGVLVPLVAVTFLAVRTTLGRLDDTNKHLGRVNTLYLSTIETLAMAIDAKDQVTHGHIRRVQRYAVGLAKAVGIVDDRQLRAIEAAALLHDLGKLAIPEFILNKPGTLTTRESSVMKTHAALGADILSSIEFPYPVVPIVRHHHENWDGSGYPDGIKGTDIPIGARILSVVDCYDALTSARPYRAALSTEHAVDILSQRRGTMYDPLIVDAFVSAHTDLCQKHVIDTAPDLVSTTQLESTLSVVNVLPEAPRAQAASLEALRLLARLAPYPAAPPLQHVCTQLVRSLRSVVPFDTVAIFVVDETSSDAAALFVEGSAASVLANARIALGEQLSGWVAAHRTSVWNSNAALDLAVSSPQTRLTVGSSMPLCVDDNLVGALTLYGHSDQVVAADQRRALESLLPTIAATLRDALQRPWISIDCCQPHIRDAALTALDSLLSHNRFSTTESAGTVLALSIDSLSPSRPRATLSVESAMRALAAALSPRHAETRCVVKMDATHLLFCALDATPIATLLAETEAAGLSRVMREHAVSVAPVSTSFELQDRVRLMVDVWTAPKALGGLRGRQP